LDVLQVDAVRRGLSFVGSLVSVCPSSPSLRRGRSRLGKGTLRYCFLRVGVFGAGSHADLDQPIHEFLPWHVPVAFVFRLHGYQPAGLIYFVVLEKGHHLRELVPAATRRLFLVVTQESVELQHVVPVDFLDWPVADALKEVTQRDVVGLIGFLLAAVFDLSEVLIYRRVKHQRFWLFLGRFRRPSA
jgi:hypothetical protein